MKVSEDILIPPVHSADILPCPMGGVDVVAYLEDTLQWTITHGTTVREAMQKAAHELSKRTDKEHGNR